MRAIGRIGLTALCLVVTAQARAQAWISPLSFSQAASGGWKDHETGPAPPALAAPAEPISIDAGIPPSAHLEADRAMSAASIQRGFGTMAALQSFGKGLYQLANDAQQAQALINDYPDLTPQDGPFDPNYTPPGMPEVPVSCEGKKGCSECYTDAYKRLDHLRVNFEQLRVLYGSYMNLDKAEIAFGDSIAGSVGVGGIEWTVQRQRIETAIGTLNKAYDNKYTQLLGSLKQTLMAISQCEAQQFNDPDWYNRFGYMFYSFMAARYQR